MSRHHAYRTEGSREFHPPSIILEKSEKDTEEQTEDESSDDESESSWEKIKNRASGIAIALFTIAAILIIIALCTHYWIESDRIEHTARFERMGLWSHCLRSLPDPFDPYARRFTAGCKVILGLFSAEVLEKRIPGLPAFFVAVQFLYTLCFLIMLVPCVLIPVYLIICCASPYHKRKLLIIRLIGHFTLFSAALGIIAVIIFGAKATEKDPRSTTQYVVNANDYNQNRLNHLSWSYALAVVGIILEGLAGGLFELEARVQSRE
jgi:hypothetical protein